MSNETAPHTTGSPAPEAPHSALGETRHVYARWLAAGGKISMLLLVVTFLLYLTGAVPAGVPQAELVRHWSRSVDDFTRATGAPTGWEWAARLGEGDALCLLPIAALAAVSMICYLRVLPVVIPRSKTFAVIAALEVLVIALAASGLLTAGGH